MVYIAIIVYGSVFANRFGGTYQFCEDAFRYWRTIMGWPRVDYTGRKYGRLTVLRKHKPGKPYNRKWYCECECGKVVILEISNVYSGRTQSCGCLNSEMSRDRIAGHTGTAHPAWKDDKDISTTRREMRHLWYKDWRIAVFERDEYTCQACSKKKVYLNAHHIYSWAAYPLKRIFLSNGITLCRSCHRKFHKKYGTKRTTEADLTNWLA